ncbi:MAG: hypothetical protein NTW86_02705, partial [Candidatus Sumerlaeota bacterium]|nr:hypothetical protein [Candidatus Sumerlaeota bacterium]
LAMGKLGAREMNFFSDLDLVFIHGEAPRELDDAARFHARWAQGIVRILSEVTPAGTVFKVDARLRPEGRNAPLTAPLERYVDYYAHRAQTWEFQSLLRSRWIAGDEALVEELRARVAEPMARVGARLDLANDIRSMRARVEQSVRLPSWARADFKRGRGGVVDLEFLVQYLQLRGFAAGGAKFLPEFDDAVAEMKACGLLRADRAEALTRNYRFLRLLEARSRLLFSTTSNYLPLAPGRLAPLEFFLADALPEGLKLTEHVLRVMRENRALFEEIVK